MCVGVFGPFCLNGAVRSIFFDVQEDITFGRRLDETLNIDAVIHGGGEDTLVITKAITDFINGNPAEIVSLLSGSGIETVEATTSTVALDDAPTHVLSSGAKSLTPINAVVASAAVSIAVAVPGAMGAMMGMGN